MAGLRERHMDRTRTAIVEVALRLFAEQGFAETTVEQIAREADVSRRTFFRYFPAKEGVLFCDANEKLDLALDALRARPIEEPPYQALVEVLRDTALRFTGDHDRQRLLAQLSAEDETLLSHHRGVVMAGFEDAVVAEMTARLDVGPNDVGARAAVSALTATFGSAVRCWIEQGADVPFEPFLTTALDTTSSVLGAVSRSDAPTS